MIVGQRRSDMLALGVAKLRGSAPPCPLHRRSIHSAGTRLLQSAALHTGLLSYHCIETVSFELVPPLQQAFLSLHVGTVVWPHPSESQCPLVDAAF